MPSETDALAPLTVAVAAAGYPEVLAGLAPALQRGWLRALLVGDRQSILSQAEQAALPPGTFTVVSAAHPAAAAAEAVRLTATGKADLLMKGRMLTADLLRAVVAREGGLRTERPLVHVAVFQLAGREQPLLLTDAAINPAPDLARKAEMLRAVAEVAAGLGIAAPRIAILAAVEKVSTVMPATVEAAILSKMAERGQFGALTVDGPLALDAALSPRAVAIKGLGGPVAGQADALVAPDIEAANILYKALVHLLGAHTAGVVTGARKPIVLQSRGDLPAARYASLVLAARLAEHLPTGALPPLPPEMPAVYSDKH